MSNLFEDLERKGKMIFIEENSEEDKEYIMQKEQNALNDFIKNLDKKIYKDLGNFPLKYPEKIKYPEYIETGDDFILLSVKDEFYLFPKILTNKLLDLTTYNNYFKKNPIKSKILEKKLNNILDTCYISIILTVIFGVIFGLIGCARDNGLIFSTGMIILLSFSIPMVIGAVVENDISVIKNMNKYEEFLSKLEKLNFPLEFFRKNSIDKIYIKKSELDEYKEHFSL